MTIKKYGEEDTSFLAAGGEIGLKQLANDFYIAMGELPQAENILNMHPENIMLSEEKLALFLCGWLGGPKLFREKWGAITIPTAHQHLEIGSEERDAWLDCMATAVKQQPWVDDFKQYFFHEIRRPAYRVQNIDT